MSAPAPLELGALPSGWRMRTVDERVVRSPADRMFDLARDVERWPDRLTHYRWVRFRERRRDGGGIVEMAANRPFGPLNWPTWWLSEMQVLDMPRLSRSVRFRHVGGVTRGMEVEWSFTPESRDIAPNGGPESTRVRIVHVWDGPPWPIVGGLTAVHVIGPLFIHGIASRTLAGLAAVAEQGPDHGKEQADAVCRSE
jgi:ribosome-associated toxin RatA of RatAB toxin-antitoxin module